MKKTNLFLFVAMFIVVSIFFVFRNTMTGTSDLSQINDNDSLIISGNFDQNKYKSNQQWKELLTDHQYNILRQAGTEIPFTGKLNKEKRAGTYYSVGCDIPLFRSETKYDSKTGWPSFWAPIDENNLVLKKDDELGTSRIEVLDKCGSHLGHVFNDGPKPTGQRYCINSAALKFIPD